MISVVILVILTVCLCAYLYFSFKQVFQELLELSVKLKLLEVYLIQECADLKSKLDNIEAKIHSTNPNIIRISKVTQR